jgi:hypothetical protein
MVLVDQGHSFKQVVILTPKKKGCYCKGPLFILGVDFKVFVCNDIGCQGHDFKQVVILTPK